MALDPALAASYDTCRRLNARHGKTYYLATLLLPAAKRPAVHALYGFARYADEIVDDLADPRSAAERASALTAWGSGFLTDVRSGRTTDPVGRAVLDTITRWDIPLQYFEDFLTSMGRDLTVASYPTYADLQDYMWGSAAVIGLQMLPILQPSVPVTIAAPYAVALGQAFQLTNFLRDIGEDLQRGRLYLPLEDLAAHGVGRDALELGLRDGAFRRLMAAEIDRARSLYRQAEPGIALLHPTSRDCVRVAFRLYQRILDEIEDSDYDVLRARVRVSRARRLRVAGPGLARAWLERQRGRMPSAAPATPTSRR